jgi:hypothetical protein
MRAFGVFGTIVAASVMLAACTKQGSSDPGANGSVARQGATSPASMAASSTVLANAAKPVRFAALPDRGELLHYDAHAPVRDGAYTWHRTELSEQHALDAIKGGVLRVVTPSGRLLGFQYDRSVRHDESGDWTWIGHLPGQESVQAILTFGKDAVYGSIGQPDTRPLRLTTQGGASWLVETDPSQLAGLASRAANPVSPDYKIVTPSMLQRLRERQAAMGARTSALAPMAASATATATPTVDLLIGYTQGFVTAKGSTSAVVTRLNSMVDTANIGLQNSQVNGQIRLVHTMQVNYTDTNTNDAALGQLTGYDTDTQKETTPNAAFNALRTARETYKADLVSLVRPFREPEQDSCGIAWLVGGGKQGNDVAPSNGWDYFGYSVVSDGTDRNEKDGKNYFCEEHTLAHELGHNMGSAHDRATSKGDDGVLDDPDDYGAFAYSFGYKPGAFYTIMAYGDKGQTSYLAFSNPRITFCGGVACGVADSEDNARSLGTLLPIVGQFRASIVDEPPASVPNDLDGDGKSDLLFRYNQDVSSNYSFWIMSGKSKVRNWRETVGAGNSAAVTGDFNGDGKADIVWQNTRNQLYMWFGTGTGFSKGNYAGTLQSGWSVVAAGDINGDGKSDLVLRYNQSVAYNLTFWIMDGAKFKDVTSATVAAGNALSAVGDFNGDGLLDIVWTNSSLGVYMWLGRGDSTFQGGSKVGTLTSGWSVRGAGDFNGDGKDDLLLGYNKAVSGNLSIWTMHGAVRAGITHYTLGSGNTISSIGDFDGNGRADIVFTNSRRQLYMWLGRSTTTGFSAGNYVGTLGAGWSILDPGK